MRNNKILPILLLALALVWFLLPSPDSGALPTPASQLSLVTARPVEAAAAKTPAPTEARPSPTAAPELPDEDGTYTEAEDVALYVHTYGHLPSNFMTKKEAREQGWTGGALDRVVPGMSIGGDYFGNYEGKLPKAKGRQWTECDVGPNVGRSRPDGRLVFSNDGLIYYTADHYESFELLYD